MKKERIKPATDRETEPDYGITLKCIYCDKYEATSGQKAEYHGVDGTNFVCTDCRYLVD